MIISKTPFRISFVGGGSDLPSYYLNHGGAVLSTSIDKYIYLSMHSYFVENKYFLKYSKNELTDNVEDIIHPIIREVFKYFEIKGVDFNSSADLPSGTGMGSSSAFTSGLINLCCTYKGVYMSREAIADLACKIEIDILKEPIGKQDQYACAVGGLNFIEFNKDNTVNIEKIHLDVERSRTMSNNLLLFYLGNTRSASSVLSEQKQNIEDGKKIENLGKMVQLAYELKSEILKGEIDVLGESLHKGWILKKELASGISSQNIDYYYDLAIKAGAIGGKLLGAGGGGFLLFYVKQNNQQSVKNALKDLTYTEFNLDKSGTKIIY
jgi:D-glycero-alpha-D-manno-heptose-7-phosphate kinase